MCTGVITGAAVKQEHLCSISLYPLWGALTLSSKSCLGPSAPSYLCLTIYRRGEHDKKNRKPNYRSLRLERDQVTLWSISPSLKEEILKCLEPSWWHSSWQMQQSFWGYDGTKTDLNRSAPSLGARRSPFSPAEALDHCRRLTITSQTWMSKGPLSCSTPHCTL